MTRDYITVSQNFGLKCSVHPKICLTEVWGEKMRSLPVWPGRSGPWPKHCRKESQVLDAPPALPPARWRDLRLSLHGSGSEWLRVCMHEGEQCLLCQLWQSRRGGWGALNTLGTPAQTPGDSISQVSCFLKKMARCTVSSDILSESRDSAHSGNKCSGGYE